MVLLITLDELPHPQVALMLSRLGSSSVDVFRMATSQWEKRQAKILEKAKMWMMKQKGYDQTESYWSNLWGKPREHQSIGLEGRRVHEELQQQQLEDGESTQEG
ncbi:hypothetical protein LOK49_LG07G00682 [Camellia lanceoleosa]|uniref:Uncharacterized protein n=1 Tax=Camellia lanceoleosa TaxID=1840588 RepID=A0ACC0H0X2_9ERIC|nr:hypothetical protein LOK49_LG07G00682 [Camellia lanceoleosa]